MTGTATVMPQLKKLCASWLEDNEASLFEFLRHSQSAADSAALADLLKSEKSFRNRLCHAAADRTFSRACPPMPPIPKSAEKQPTKAPKVDL